MTAPTALKIMFRKNPSARELLTSRSLLANGYGEAIKIATTKTGYTIWQYSTKNPIEDIVIIVEPDGEMFEVYKRLRAK